MAILVSDRPGGERRFWPTPKRVRAERGGETIVDSRGAVLVWEPGMPVPVYAFPRSDVLEGVATRPYDDAELEAYVHVPWGAADAWFEEDEQIHFHPRDPFKRVDALRSARHVVVAVGGEVVADTRRPVLVFETGLPTRHYLPRDDVRMDRLTESATRTSCPYKGTASYWSLAEHADIAWTYPECIEQKIEGLVAFFDERADLTVDGVAQERPVTAWSRAS